MNALVVNTTVTCSVSAPIMLARLLVTVRGDTRGTAHGVKVSGCFKRPKHRYISALGGSGPPPRIFFLTSNTIS